MQKLGGVYCAPGCKRCSRASKCTGRKGEGDSGWGGVGWGGGGGGGGGGGAAAYWRTCTR
jgi:hypothetical protein